MRKITLFLLTLVCAVSCIYPYEVEVEGIGGNLCVEGDIVLGSTSSFALSYLIPLGGEESAIFAPIAELWVEDKAGNKYPGTLLGVTSSKVSEYEVDLSDADQSLEHRLYIKVFGGGDSSGWKEYASAWAMPSGTCVIDKLGYRFIEENDEKVAVDIVMSMHSEDGTNHFRYRYTEDWEYSSTWKATHYYIPELTPDTPYGQVVKFENGENTYYCWDHEKSRGINLATTETMGINKLEDYPLFRYGRENKKLSILYRLDLEVYPVSEESYRYLEHIRNVSTYDGNLFAPIPSEVRGNLRCVYDDDEIVYGYIGISCPQKARIYIDNDRERIYKPVPDRNAIYEAVSQDNWYLYFRSRDYRPYYEDMKDGLMWAPTRCVDCRRDGGTKNKPADWPNNHM